MSAAGFGDVAAAEKAGARRSFPSLANNRPSPIAPPTDSAVSCFHASGEPLHSAAVIRRISIVDYGMGNLFSVARAFSHLACEVTVTSDPAAVREAEAVLLPGVGAFAEAMARLDAAGLSGALRDRAAADRPLFGVCLGMQLLFAESAEYGRHAGLGVFHGAVSPLPAASGLKIPHMGWNQVRAVGDSPLLRGLDGEDFYFVHSFAVPDSPEAAGRTDYGESFVSAAARGAVAATQFHPEKSSAAGLALYRNWLEAF